MSKIWQREVTYANRRAEKKLHIRKRILIVCEGKKTEPNYFKKFPVDTKIVEINVQGDGANTLSLVESAVKLKDKAELAGKQYNQIWCVFDRDSFFKGNFNEAFKVARKSRISIAYSNQCFELWYLLHFCFSDAAIDRCDYVKKLTKLMGRKYKKNDENMYAYLNSRQESAIKNAKKLRNRYWPCNPEKDDPSTTVYRLVEALNEYLPNS